MNKRSDIDRVLEIWMADGPSVMPDRIVDVVADRISVQRQRRSWRLLRRLPMNPLFKLGAAAAAVLVVAVVGYNLLPGPAGPGAGPSPSPSPSPTATSSPVATEPLPLPASGVLTGGQYRIQIDEAPKTLSVLADIPAGWISFGFALVSPGDTENTGTLISFMEPDSLFSDPCHWDVDGTGSETQAGDIVPGPSVDDLVAALKANTSYTSTDPAAVTFGEYEGQALQLQLPGDAVLSTCDDRSADPGGDYFVFSNGFYAQGPDSLWDLVIVDVDGTRLVVMSSYAASSTPGDIDAARRIVESFKFTP